VGVLDRDSGTVKWEMALPTLDNGLTGQPLAQGLAVDRSGNIIVTLYNGNVLCYGTGTVSVAQREPTMPQAPMAASAASVASAWESGALAVRPGNVTAQLPSASAEAHQAASAVGHSLCQADSPADTPPLYDPRRDTSDLVPNAQGVLVHSLPPDERAARASYRPHDMTWRPESECLPVAGVEATSAARGCPAAGTIDRDLASRWSPSKSGSQSITYDLGAVREVSAVSVVWYATKASRATFSIRVSTDGKRFAQVDQGLLSGRGTNTTLRAFVAADARFVRITLEEPAGVSLYEVGIHRSGEARQAAR
jgi:hypothetical protein